MGFRVLGSIPKCMRHMWLAQEGSCREDAWEFQWGISNASRAWEAAHKWPPDPEWTESNWPAGGVPAYRLYQVGLWTAAQISGTCLWLL